MTHTDVSLAIQPGSHRQTFTDDQKRRIIAEGRTGSRNVHFICRAYRISRQTFYDWERTLGLARTRPRFSPEERMRIVSEGRGGPNVVCDVCTRHHISRQTFYNWESRLAGTRDASRLIDRRPAGNCRNLTPQWVVDRVLALRAQASPSRSTPVRISDVIWNEHNFRISPSAVFRILRRQGQSSLFRRSRRVPALLPAGSPISPPTPDTRSRS